MILMIIRIILLIIIIMKLCDDVASYITDDPKHPTMSIPIKQSLVRLFLDLQSLNNPGTRTKYTRMLAMPMKCGRPPDRW
jgi:hypothetical protein